MAEGIIHFLSVYFFFVLTGYVILFSFNDLKQKNENIFSTSGELKLLRKFH